MTSQRDETVGHMADDEMMDGPIVVERHDEILGGPPAEDPEPGDAFARDVVADDSTPATDPVAGDEPVSDRSADGELASDEPVSDGLASDEMAARPMAPDPDSAELVQDPPPLVVPAGPAPDDPADPGPEATSGSPAAVAEPLAPVIPGADPVDASPVDASPVETSPAEADSVDASPVAATPVDASPAVTNPAVTNPADAGPPAASVSETAGPNGDGVPAAALAGQQWPAIQAMFVDDPKGSVERAAAAADEVAKAFVASLQREQTALRAAWEKDTTTEDLRTALQQYRAFCGRLEGLA